MMSLEHLPDLLSTDDVSSYLRIDVETARRLIRNHADVLHPFKIGRATRLEKTRFEMFLYIQQNKNNQKTSVQ